MTAQGATRPAGLVLAGGAGRRLGRSKGDLVLAGSTLAERAAATLAPLCADVWISLAPGAPNFAARCRAVYDEPPAGRGPLAGIEAGFRAAGGADLLVLACDYPRVDGALLERLLALAHPAADLVFPIDGRARAHPLVGLWRARLAGTVRAALRAERYAVRALAAEVCAQRLGAESFPGLALDERLVNLNEPRDLESVAGGETAG